MRRLGILFGAMALVLSGCFWFLPEEAIQFTFEETVYGYEATVDFGFADPSGGGVTLVGTLMNLTSRDIEVESIAVDNSDFAAALPDLPFTVPAGGTIEASLTFLPAESGESAGTLTVTVAGVAEPFVLNLSGDGNHAPVAYAVATVSGAGELGANGSYRRVGTLLEIYVWDLGLGADISYPTPTYEKEGGGYTIWATNNDGGLGWVLDNDFAPPTWLYGRSYSTTALFAPTGNESNFWPVSTGADPGPTVVGEIESSVPNITYVGDTITAAYDYEDVDGDPEGATVIQWVMSDNILGPYSAIAGENALTLTVPIEANFKYVAVHVTPVATAGITAGAVAFIGPIRVDEF